MSTNPSVILVVEDEPLQAEMYTIFLEQAGYETLHAEDGVEALSILRDGGIAISVILSDMFMPNMDGDELYKQVKNDESLKDIPFIFVSALADIDEKIKGYTAGGDDYVVKPVSSDELIEKVKRAVNQYQKKL